MKIDKAGKDVCRWGFKAFVLFFIYLYGDYSRPFVEGLANVQKLNVLLGTLLLVLFFGGLAYFTEES